MHLLHRAVQHAGDQALTAIPRATGFAALLPDGDLRRLEQVRKRGTDLGEVARHSQPVHVAIVLPLLADMRRFRLDVALVSERAPAGGKSVCSLR